jgi:Domain of unknown function (DUF5667)
MITLFGYRQRAEELAARLDGRPVQGRRTGGASAETDALVKVVAALRQHADQDEAACPQAAFATDLRARLLAEAALMPARTGQQRSPDPARSSYDGATSRPRRVRERLVVAGVAAAIVIGGTAGVADAAQSALPGQALYPVKRSIEGVDARLAGSPAAHGRALLDQASTRLDEVRGLDAGGPLERQLIPGTLDEFTRQAHEGALLLMRGYRENEDPKSIEEVRSFAADQLPVLAKLSVSTADEARSQLQDAAVALQSIDSEASSACSDCSDLAPLTLPPLNLASLEVDAAPDASSTGGSDLLPGSEDVVAAQSSGKDGAGTLLPPGTGMTPGATPGNGVAALPPDASPDGATPTPTAASGTTGGVQPTSGASTSNPGTGSTVAPGSAGVPTSGAAPVMAAPPRVPILTMPSGGSTSTAPSTTTGVEASTSQPAQPAPSTAPVVSAPTVTEAPAPVEQTSSVAPSSEPTTPTGSPSSDSTASSSGTTSSADPGSTSGSTSSSADPDSKTAGGTADGSGTTSGP